MSGEKKSDRNIGRIRLIAVAVLVLLAAALVLKAVLFIGSISRRHLNSDGLTHAERFEDSVIVHGIDVSEYQDEINWKKVKSSEADFVFIRAGYRSTKEGELCKDADFDENIKAANKAGIMTGAYFFSQALNEEEAIEEAEYLLKLVAPYDIQMPLVIDFEIIEGGRLDEAIDDGQLPASSMYHDIVLAFCRRVEEAGYESAVYANYDMLTNYMDSTLLDDEAVIWAAQYGGKCGVPGDYLFWQCSDAAEISGIKEPVDHDIWYIEPGRVYKTKAAGKKEQVSIGDCTIEFKEESCQLHNHRAKPKVSVWYQGRKLRNGRDYIISFVKNTTKGKGYAVVRGIGKYKDWTAVPFTIE